MTSWITDSTDIDDSLTMYNIVYDEIVAVLNDPVWNRPIVNIHLPQRAKFEKYLQSVLACRLNNQFPGTKIEYLLGGKLIDIYANRTCIELKTPNTNYTIQGITNKARPITKNITSIINDIQKLRTLNVKSGVVAFVLFPIDPNNNSFLYHVNKIVSALGHNQYCSNVVGNMFVFSCQI